MQNSLKKRALAVLLAVAVIVTYMPIAMWESGTRAYAGTPNVEVYSGVTLDSSGNPDYSSATLEGGYETLAEAMGYSEDGAGHEIFNLGTGVQDGQTIKLNSNLTEKHGTKLMGRNDIILDLNGKTVTFDGGNGAAGLYIGGGETTQSVDTNKRCLNFKLTGGGTLVGGTTGIWGVLTVRYGTATIYDCTMKVTTTNKAAGALLVEYGSEVTVKGGNFNGDATGTTGARIGSGATCSIDGGTFTGNGGSVSVIDDGAKGTGKVVINGGTFTGDVLVNTNVENSINGGTFNSGVVTANGGKLTISKATITGAVKSDGSGSKVTIDGATIPDVQIDGGLEASNSGTMEVTKALVKGTLTGTGITLKKTGYYETKPVSGTNCTFDTNKYKAVDTEDATYNATYKFMLDDLSGNKVTYKSETNDSAQDSIADGKKITIDLNGGSWTKPANLSGTDYTYTLSGAVTLPTPSITDPAKEFKYWTVVAGTGDVVNIYKAVYGDIEYEVSYKNDNGKNTSIKLRKAAKIQVYPTTEGNWTKPTNLTVAGTDTYTVDGAVTLGAATPKTADRKFIGWKVEDGAAGTEISKVFTAVFADKDAVHQVGFELYNHDYGHIIHDVNGKAILGTDLEVGQVSEVIPTVLVSDGETLSAATCTADEIQIDGLVVQNPVGYIDEAGNYFKFAGWTTTKDGTAYVTPGTVKITEDTIFYAHWTQADYKVTYDLNGQEIENAYEYNYPAFYAVGEQAVKPVNPVAAADGVVFKFWTTTEDGTTAYDFDTVLTKNIKLYAQWAPATCKVSFDLDGGKIDGNAADAQPVVYGEKATKPAKDPVKNLDTGDIDDLAFQGSYTFLGWYAKGATEAFDFSTPITEDITLTAKWEAKPVVTIYSEEDNDMSYLISVAVIKKGDSLASVIASALELLLENPTIISAIIGDIDSTDDIGDLADSYLEIKKAFVQYMENQRPGYTFLGFVDENGETLDFSQRIEGDMTIYGHWEKQPVVTIYADKNNMTYGDRFYVKKGERIYNKQITYKDEMIYLPTDKTTVDTMFAALEDARTGYNFLGFYTEEDEMFDFGTPITEDTSLYGKWEKKTFTVNFNMNGHGDEQTPQTVAYGETATKPATPTADGYAFEGWYVDGAEFSFGSTPITKDTTIYAKWSDKVQTVSFVENVTDATTVKQTAFVAYGNKMLADQIPTVKADNKVFAGWYTEAEGGEPFEFGSTAITEDITLYAHWATESCVVTFNMDGYGEQIPNITVAAGTVLGSVTTIEDPEAVGKIFKGWTPSSGLLTIIFNTNPNTFVVDEDVEFIANWDDLEFDVVFNKNTDDAVANMPATLKDVVYNTRITAPAEIPTRDNYTFAGWAKDPEGKEPFDFNTERITDNTTLYAQWNQNACIVTFDNNGVGDELGSVMVGAGTLLGAAYKVQNPTAEGYVFKGWKLVGDIVNPNKQTITKDTVFVAQWETEKHTVYFNGSAADAKKVPADKVVEYGKKITEPAEPMLEGAEFVAWTTDKAGKNVFDFNTDTITEDITLYAQWSGMPVVTVYAEENNMTFVERFYVKSGERIQNFQLKYKDDEIAIKIDAASLKATYRALENAREGYKFLGFFDKNGKAFDWGTAITEDTALYGKWEKKTYAVTFDMGQHGTQVDGQNVPYEEYATKPADPTATGWVFKGWLGADGKVFDFTTKKITEDTVVYAKWEKASQAEDNQYNVTFFANGGTWEGEVAIEKFVDGDKGVSYVGAPEEDPTRDGYEFAGWYTEGGKIWAFSSDAVTKDMVLLAKWEQKTYAVTFDMGQHGTQVDGQNVPYAEHATKPADPTATGWVFKGWLGADGKVFDFTTKKITEDTVVYAKWEKASQAEDNQYNVTFFANGGKFAADTEKPLVAVEKFVDGDKGVSYVGAPEEDPTREGYEFAGWYTEGGKIWAFSSDKVDKDMVLLAKWEAMPVVTIYADENNMTFVERFYVKSGERIQNFQIEYKDDVIKLSADVEGMKKAYAELENAREGYKFLGFFDKNGKAFDWGTAITEDTSLYGKWEKKQFTVSFDTDGYDVSVDDQTIAYGELAKTPADPKVEGMNFMGWYDKDGKRFDFDTPIKENVRLTGKWEAKVYTVQYNTKGGTDVEEGAALHGTLFNKPAVNPTKDGKIFVGWYEDVLCLNFYDWATPATKDIVLYAKWADNGHVVSFEMNGHGAQVEPQVVLDKDTAKYVNNPEAEGYTFAGWFNEDGTAFSFDQKITKDTVVNAKWTAKKYTILFESKAGNNVASETVDYGQMFTKPGDPTWAGHTFVGWYEDKDCTQIYDFATPATKDITVYARWIEDGKVVSFDMNGHGAQVEPQVVLKGSKATTPAIPQAEGYTFKQWNVAETGAKWNFNDPVTENVELVAEWDAKTYTILFESKAGTAVASEKADNGQMFTKPEDPTWTGHKFVGWYIDKDCTAIYDFATPATKNITVYARWIEDGKVVSFDMNGHGAQVEPQVVLNEGKAKTPAIPKAEGYTFVQWNVAESNAKWNFNDKVTEDIELVAEWKVNTYHANMNYNGGVETEHVADVKYGSAFNQPTKPIRNHYEFVCWCTDSALENEYNWATKATGDIELYAKWKKTTYAVNFNTNVDGVYVEGQRVEYNGFATKPENPTAKFKEFLGWYSDKELKNVFSFASTPITKDTELYAKWDVLDEHENEKYEVTFDANGGKFADDKTEKTATVDKAAHQSYVEAPDKPTKDGHNFIGWFTENDVKWTKDYVVTGDTVFYAKWELKSVTVSFNVVKEFQQGAKGSEPADQVIPWNTAATMPEDPTCEGYRFVGWYKMTETGLEDHLFDFTTLIKEDTQLVAKWEKKMYVLKFYDQTGDHRKAIATLHIQEGTTLYDLFGTDGLYSTAEDSVNEQLYNAGYTKNPNNTMYAKVGYQFEQNGWYQDEGYTDRWDWQDSEQVITKNMNLYGKWEPISYELKYFRGNKHATAKNGYADAKNGTHHQTLTYDTNVNLDANGYEYTGHEFIGWALVKNYNPEKYNGYMYKGDVVARFANNACVNTTIDGVDTDVIQNIIAEQYLAGQLAEYSMVAEWAPIQYQITYDKNAADAKGDKYYQTLSYNDTEDGFDLAEKDYTTLENKFQRKGYHFVGWNTQADGKGVDVTGEIVNKNDSNHAECSDASCTKDDDHPCYLATGVKALNVLYDVDGTVKRDKNLTSEKDGKVTLYAQWAPCKNYHYTVTTWKEATEAEYNAAKKAGTPVRVEDEDSKDYYPTYFVAVIESKVGTTGETVTVKPSVDVNAGASTANLTITLDAKNFEDACPYTSGCKKATKPAAANIDVVEKAKSKVNRKHAATAAYAPEAKTLTYNAQDQELVTPGKTEDGTIYYAVDPNLNDNAKDWNWSTEIPKAKEEGKYDIWYYIKGNGETTQDSEPVKVGTTVINPKEIKIYWGKTKFAYDGLNHIPTATPIGVYEGDKCFVTVTYDEGTAATKYVGEKEIGTNYTATVYEDALSNHNYCVTKVSTKFDITAAVLLAKATPVKSTMMKISWTGVSGATRYDVYAVNCGKTSKYQYKGTTGAGIKTMTIAKAGGKKMKAHTAYKFYVVAYSDTGKIAKSNNCHAITAKTKKKAANPTKITPKKTQVVVNETDVSGVPVCKLTLPKGKTILSKAHSVAPFRYVSGDTGICTVDSNGTIRGVHAGTCYVYVQAINGMWCSIKVIVQ